jgi:hypothetical protein
VNGIVLIRKLGVFREQVPRNLIELAKKSDILLVCLDTVRKLPAVVINRN